MARTSSYAICIYVNVRNTKAIRKFKNTKERQIKVATTTRNSLKTISVCRYAPIAVLTLSLSF